MFDIGFLELIVIAVVALLVIGPEQLPGALRTAGLWIGRFKRGIQSTRQEIEQQIGADEIRRQLHNEEVMQRLNASKAEIERVVYREKEALTAAVSTETQLDKSTSTSTTETSTVNNEKT